MCCWWLLYVNVFILCDCGDVWFFGCFVSIFGVEVVGGIWVWLWVIVDGL